MKFELKTSLPSRQEGERTSDLLGFQELRTAASWVSQEGGSGRGGTTPRGCGSPAWQLDEDKKISRSRLLPLGLSLVLALIDAVQLEARIFQLVLLPLNLLQTALFKNQVGATLIHVQLSSEEQNKCENFE